MLRTGFYSISVIQSNNKALCSEYGIEARFGCVQVLLTLLAKVDKL